MNAAAHNDPNPRRLYRDTENGMLAGVCAGIGDYFGISVRGLRWLVFLSCAFAMPAIFMAYIVAIFLLPRKPDDLYDDEGEEEFWRSIRRDPHFTCDDIRLQFRALDKRLQQLHMQFNLLRFDLDQKFRDLE